MPKANIGDAEIYYEEHGKGFPILTFAPAGLQSTIKVWSGGTAPIDPVAEWSSTYRVIVMEDDDRMAELVASPPLNVPLDVVPGDPRRHRPATRRRLAGIWHTASGN